MSAERLGLARGHRGVVRDQRITLATPGVADTARAPRPPALSPRAARPFGPFPRVVVAGYGLLLTGAGGALSLQADRVDAWRATGIGFVLLGIGCALLAFAFGRGPQRPLDAEPALGGPSAVHNAVGQPQDRRREAPSAIGPSARALFVDSVPATHPGPPAEAPGCAVRLARSDRRHQGEAIAAPPAGPEVLAARIAAELQDLQRLLDDPAGQCPAPLTQAAEDCPPTQTQLAPQPPRPDHKRCREPGGTVEIFVLGALAAAITLTGLLLRTARSQSRRPLFRRAAGGPRAPRRR